MWCSLSSTNKASWSVVQLTAVPPSVTPWPARLLWSCGSPFPFHVVHFFLTPVMRWSCPFNQKDCGCLFQALTDFDHVVLPFLDLQDLSRAVACSASCLACSTSKTQVLWSTITLHQQDYSHIVILPTQSARLRLCGGLTYLASKSQVMLSTSTLHQQDYCHAVVPTWPGTLRSCSPPVPCTSKTMVVLSFYLLYCIPLRLQLGGLLPTHFY